MLLKKLSRLSCDDIVADDLFDFDIQYQAVFSPEPAILANCRLGLPVGAAGWGCRLGQPGAG